MKVALKSLCLLVGSTIMSHGQDAVTYQKPPEAIERMLDARPTPSVSISPDRKTMLVEQPADFPTIADVAEPRFRLAGIRFNPASNGPSREFPWVGLSLQSLDGSAPRPIAGLPARLRATHVMWSPDGRSIAFVERTSASDHAAAAHKPGAAGTAATKAAANGAGLQLYVIDVMSAHARRVGTVRLNAVLGAPCAWMPDSASLLCTVVPAERGAAPKASDVPTGPNVEENLGRVSPARTYEDLLKTPADEAIFEFYATSQLAIVPLAGPIKVLAVKGLLQSAEPSPDGHYALVEQLHRPFSYTLPDEMFPLKVETVALQSGAVHVLSDRALVDNLPIAFDAVPAGPRDYEWRSDQPATVVWAEAGDGGNPAVEASVRDSLYSLAAPFNARPAKMLDLPMRFRGVVWGDEHLALVNTARWSDRQVSIQTFDPNAATASDAKLATIYKGSSQDRYHLPGRAVTEPNRSGHPVLRLSADGSSLYFLSPGATPAGDQPYVSSIPRTGGAASILWRSANPAYAEPVALLADNTVLIRRESETVSPNYYTVPLSSSAGGAAEPKAVTHFASPFAGMKLPTKQLIKYKRADGVDLTATLWVPAGYDKSQGPLPTLMEAYPAEFKTRAAASQVSGSPNRFPRVNWGSPVFFTQAGYAVLQDASIPIVGEGNAQPNDTYVEQLVAGARAAIDYGASLGIVDPKRVAVMGHSYGAFMTANLLAHSDLFRAGIARSGAYNRTLTPYGFQAEERTYWQAPEVYFKMSPFSYADKIKTPLLMIHGEADDNQGTFPIQSERFYQALKGQGATVRLVWLPLEAHGYEAHESLSHMLWEMNRWLDTYVKPTQPIPR